MTPAAKSSAKKTSKANIPKKSSSQSVSTDSPEQQAQEIVVWLRKNAKKATLDGMARYGLPTEKAFGVPVGVMLKVAKRLKRNHSVALALWELGHFEARMMATYLSEPDRMTVAEMDKWCKESDNWGICDTAAWHAYEKSPHAWTRIEKWGKARGEYEKRSSLALLATIALHDKSTPDKQFVQQLPMVEKAAQDERNFVFKGANWALRSIGLRSAALRAECLKIAERLAASEDAGARWAGKDALRKLAKAAPKKSK